MNVVILQGRLTDDPKVWYGNEGNSVSVARYTLAVDRYHKKEGEDTADFIHCVTFIKGAAFAAKYLKKGMKITIRGSIQTGNYTNRDGVKVGTTEVVVAYLVDLDSAQIADDKWYYPSNVGIPEFRSPEHIYDDDFSFRRKKADDVWIMQMLIFHMLTPDGDPYAGSRDFDDERDIIAKGYYPYQAGNIGAEDQIKGSIWHMIVSHFPKFLKELFWNSFHGNGKYFHEETRRSSLDWLRTIVRYQEALPGIVKVNPESGKYLPESYPKQVQSKGNVKINAGDSDMELEDILEQLKNFNQGWNNV